MKFCTNTLHPVKQVGIWQWSRCFSWLLKKGQDIFPTHAVIDRGDHPYIGPWICDGLIPTHTAMKQHFMGGSWYALFTEYGGLNFSSDIRRHFSNHSKKKNKKKLVHFSKFKVSIVPLSSHSDKNTPTIHCLCPYHTVIKMTWPAGWNNCTFNLLYLIFPFYKNHGSFIEGKCNPYQVGHGLHAQTGPQNCIYIHVHEISFLNKPPINHVSNDQNY